LDRWCKEVIDAPLLTATFNISLDCIGEEDADGDEILQSCLTSLTIQEFS